MHLLTQNKLGSHCTNRAPGSRVPKIPAVTKTSLSMKLVAEASTARFTPVGFDDASSAESSLSQVGGVPASSRLTVPASPTSPVCDCKPRLAKSVCWKSALQLLTFLSLEELKRASKLIGGSLVPIMKGKDKRRLRGNIIAL